MQGSDFVPTLPSSHSDPGRGRRRSALVKRDAVRQMPTELDPRSPILSLTRKTPPTSPRTPSALSAHPPPNSRCLILSDQFTILTRSIEIGLQWGHVRALRRWAERRRMCCGFAATRRRASAHGRISEFRSLFRPRQRPDASSAPVGVSVSGNGGHVVALSLPCPICCGTLPRAGVGRRDADREGAGGAESQPRRIRVARRRAGGRRGPSATGGRRKAVSVA